MARTHGMYGTPEYIAWRNIKNRCNNKSNDSYARYGGRGISVCAEWIDDFTRFYSDMGPKPAPEMSLDRINNDGDYEPSNCRWATSKQQQSNKHTNVILHHNGESHTASEWADKLGISKDTLWRRLNVYNMPIDKALTEGRVNPWRHGTRQGYEAHKCKCDQCRASNSKRNRDRREKKLIAVRDMLD